VDVDFQEGADDVNTETDLLPLPEGDAAWCYIGSTHVYSADEMESYARANVAHAVATLQAEIEALRAEVRERDASLKWWGRFASGAVNARKEAEARADKLAEALRHQRWCRTCAEDGWESCEEGRKNDALLRDQEEGR
jgi:hypothetical protein